MDEVVEPVDLTHGEHWREFVFLVRGSMVHVTSMFELIFVCHVCEARDHEDLSFDIRKRGCVLALLGQCQGCCEVSACRYAAYDHVCGISVERFRGVSDDPLECIFRVVPCGGIFPFGRMAVVEVEDDDIGCEGYSCTRCVFGVERAEEEASSVKMNVDGKGDVQWYCRGSIAASGEDMAIPGGYRVVLEEDLVFEKTKFLSRGHLAPLICGFLDLFDAPGVGWAYGKCCQYIEELLACAAIL